MTDDTKPCPECAGMGSGLDERVGDWTCGACNGACAVPVTDQDRERAGQINALEGGREP